jgi:hypothetical protein
MAVTYTELNIRITSLEKEITSLDRSIRGSNGELGIQAKLMILERQSAPLSKLEEYFTGLKAEIVSLSRSLDALSLVVARAQKSDANGASPKTFGSWAWFRGNMDKIIWTVVTVILTTGAIFLLERWFGDFGFH